MSSSCDEFKGKKLEVLNYKLSNVGRFISTNKKHYVFQFRVDNQDHKVEVYFSYVSGKIRIIHNMSLLFNSAKYTAPFIFEF